MPKYTRQQVIDEKRCGIKYFDRAVEKIGRQSLIDQALTIRKNHPTVWGTGWGNIDWALGNAVQECAKYNGPMTWNLDEVLTQDELAYIAEKSGLKVEDYTPTWGRREPKKVVV